MRGRPRTGAARASATDAGAARADARRRHAWAVVLAAALSPLVTGCWPARSRDVTAVDLMSRVHDAERRPAGSALDVRDESFAGQSRASLFLPAESRLTFSLPIPRRAAVRFYAAVPDA